LELSGGNRRHRRRSRVRALALGTAAAALALATAACGEESSPSSDEPAGSYRAEVVTAKFPARQRLGETTLMRIGVRNTGDEPLPSLVVGVTVAGKDGKASSLPFGIRDPQPGLAQPDRPVWVLSQHYPKLAGSSDPGGAETSSNKIFNFGPLKPGRTTEAVWKLTASRTGSYSILYEVDAGIGGEAKAETDAGVQPGGSFAVTITEVPPDTIVTDSGKVVEIDEPARRTR